MTQRGVVVYWPGERGCVSSHERATHREIARRLAALNGYDEAGDYDPAQRYPGPVYVVPGDTLLGPEAEALGVRGENDLFGGVVPHPFAATKAITHPLVRPDAAAPADWSGDMGRRVKDIVLPGYSVFSRDDARTAGLCLLEHGAVRVKPVRLSGGRGQTVVADARQLQDALDAIDAAELSDGGLVLEEELADVTTRSVGHVRVADLVATYHGTQRTTLNNAGAPVYGGSELTVVRGGFDSVLGLDLPDEIRLAVAQAQSYDEAASACFPGFFASRRNYDVAQGVDGQGRRRSGVLEQSWRVGGASTAEIAALEAFRAEPGLRAVRARCVEVYGENAGPPPDATVYFRGVDDRVGFITKYSLIEPTGGTLHADAR